MTPRTIISALLLAAGGAFFLAGTLGVLRFPDARTRLHAVTKADSLGLGLVVAGLLVITTSAAVAVKLVLVWLLAIWSSAAAAYLIGGSAEGTEDQPS